MREKLIELLGTLHLPSECDDDLGWMAEQLIANGVTISNLETVNQEWIPVTERLPEYGSHILTFGGKDLVGCKTYYGVFEKIVGVRFGKITIDEVTHWMPLPEPPEGE